MAAKIFPIKRNDLRPRFRVQLIATNTNTGTMEPVDLTLASEVRFHMSDKVGPRVDGSMDFIDRTRGIVEYVWQVGDTSVAGLFRAETEVMWAGEPQTFPSSGFWTVKITEDLS